MNRALIYSMCLLIEVPRHTGDYELEAAAVFLFEETGERHGDGVSPRDASHGDGAGLPCSELAVRSFSRLQMDAIRWQCGLRLADDEHVLGVLKLLPSYCIESYAAQYEERRSEKLTRRKG